ncbi:c-type cytochrome [Cyclobacterium roseum]|uniref:c-type cytochrome n=1 Tax=Cyclobacterium roseum TaxID=2666137 RepID=UPI001390EF33|nr:c-type cytochrome [Cyclobacterium roseum]
MDEVQYISILVGWGGVMGIWSKFTEQINPGTLYTFALGGKEDLPTYPKARTKSLVNLDFQAGEEEIQNGGQIFGKYCSKCHGGGIIPDLTFSRPEIFESFHQIVGQGSLLGLGMPNYGDKLSENDIDDVKNYILSQAKLKREQLN